MSDDSDAQDPQPTDHWTRRKFLQATGVAAAALAAGPALAACGTGSSSPSAVAGTTPKPKRGARIRLLQWNSFVPEADAELKRQAKEYGDANGVEVAIETVSGDQLQPRTASAVSAGDGPDIIQMQYGWAHLYTGSCVDVSNEVSILTKLLGKIHPVNDAFCKVSGVYRAIPYTQVPNAWSWRTDYFQRAGVTSFPKTWEELSDAGKKLAAATGKPIAQTVGHAYGDSLTMWNPVLWGYGGKEVDADGKTVKINSPETLAAINWAINAAKNGIKFFPQWLDPDNNQAYHADQISATLNGASIYIREVYKEKKFDKVTENAIMPSGPKGNFTMNLIFNHAVMKWSKEAETAKAFLLYVMDKANYGKWMVAARGYNLGPFDALYDSPIYTTDPKLKAFRAVVVDDNRQPLGKWPGWPAPPSRKTSQAQTQYIVADMFAKALAGDLSPTAAIKDAEQRLKDIFEKP
jgi:multiple sugar transport system substrate-binding protein